MSPLSVALCKVWLQGGEGRHHGRCAAWGRMLGATKRQNAGPLPTAPCLPPPYWAVMSTCVVSLTLHCRPVGPTLQAAGLLATMESAPGAETATPNVAAPPPHTFALGGGMTVTAGASYVSTLAIAAPVVCGLWM